MAGVPAPDVVRIWLRVPRREIAYVKFVFESYEHVAVCRTLDPHAAVVVVLTVPDFVAQAECIVESLVHEGACARMPEPADVPDDLIGPDDA